MKNNPAKKATSKKPKVIDFPNCDEQANISPLCGKSNINKRGKTPKGNQRFYCKSFKESFNNITATVMNGTQKSEIYWGELIMGILAEDSYTKIVKSTDF